MSRSIGATCTASSQCGPNWFEIDGPGTSWYDLRANGFLSGADLRIYRLVDKNGKSLPLNQQGDYLDISTADHVILVGKGRIVPEGQDNLPDGGWVCTRYGDVFPNSWIRHGNLTTTDAQEPQNGRTYWYAVVALTADGKESAISNEVSATPQAGIDNRPHLVQLSEGQGPGNEAGAGLSIHAQGLRSAAPLKWEVLEPAVLPAGLTLNRERIDHRQAQGGRRSHDASSESQRCGRTERRAGLGREPESGGRPCGFQGQAATPQRSDGHCRQRLRDALLETKPLARRGRLQAQAVHGPRGSARAARLCHQGDSAPGALRLRGGPAPLWQFRHARRPSRVRGIGNPVDRPNWYWSADSQEVAFSLVPHPQPVPADMVDPGETCMQVKAAAGEQSIRQIVFIGTQIPKESLWYGQLEPGKHYHLEVWLRQEGLANNGEVKFSYGKGYPQIAKTFAVDGTWKKYTHDFIGTERPANLLHFGQQFNFTGPGTLWMDNCRISRCDQPEDADKCYVPNATVLAELVRRSPPARRARTGSGS